MQSTDSGKRYVSVIASASTTGQREGMGTTLRTAMAAWAGAGILILLFLASLGYVVLGGAFEPSAGSEPEAQIAKFAVEPADVGVARTQSASATSAEPTDYVPAGYVDRGRDGEGDVMNYEHD